MSWKASEKEQATVLIELLRAREPLRYGELWSRCSDQMSRMTFAKSLKQLVKSNIVIRDTRPGRKAVVLAPNPSHPTIKPYVSFMTGMHQQQNEYLARLQSITQRWKDLAEPLPREAQKASVKMAAYYNSFILAVQIVSSTFYEAELLANSPVAALVPNMVTKEITHMQHTIEPLLIDIIKQNVKQNSRLLTQAMFEWIDAMHKETLRLAKDLSS
jgi:predicted transcriptional regulator